MTKLRILFTICFFGLGISPLYATSTGDYDTDIKANNITAAGIITASSLEIPTINSNIDGGLNLTGDIHGNVSGNVYGSSVTVSGAVRGSVYNISGGGGGSSTTPETLNVGSGNLVVPDTPSLVTIGNAYDMRVTGSTNLLGVLTTGNNIILGGQLASTNDSFTINHSGTATFAGDLSANSGIFSVSGGSIQTCEDITLTSTLHPYGGIISKNGVFSIDGNTGNMYLSGSLTTTSNITAGNITANTLLKTFSPPDTWIYTSCQSFRLDDTGNLTINNTMGKDPVSSFTITADSGNTAISGALDIGGSMGKLPETGRGNFSVNAMGDVTLTSTINTYGGINSKNGLFSIDGDTGNLTITNIKAPSPVSSFKITASTGATAIADSFDVGGLMGGIPELGKGSFSVNAMGDVTLTSTLHPYGGISSKNGVFSIDGTTGDINTVGTLGVGASTMKYLVASNNTGIFTIDVGANKNSPFYIEAYDIVETSTIDTATYIIDPSTLNYDTENKSITQYSSSFKGYTAGEGYFQNTQAATVETTESGDHTLKITLPCSAIGASRFATIQIFGLAQSIT